MIEDVWSLIQSQHEALPDVSEAEREQWLHLELAQIHERDYVADPARLAALTEQVLDERGPLLVTGEPGIGKSALLANWSLEHRRSHPADRVVLHFVGESAAGTSHVEVVRHLVLQLADLVPPHLAGPAFDALLREPRRLLEALPTLLISAGQQVRLIWVIDGLDQLDASGPAQDLGWLPAALPEDVTVIASARAGRTRDVLRRRGWGELVLSPLDEEGHRSHRARRRRDAA